MSPIISVLAWIGIGALLGWLVSRVARKQGSMGTAGDVTVGIFGAIATGTIVRVMFSGNPWSTGAVASLFAAIGGACLLLSVSKLVAKAL